MAKFKDPLDNPEPFKIPKAIHNMLEECSPQGYILFSIDDIGRIRTKLHLPYQIAAEGLRSYALKILNGIDDLESDIIIEDIINQNPSEEE